MCIVDFDLLKFCSRIFFEKHWSSTGKCIQKNANDPSAQMHIPFYVAVFLESINKTTKKYTYLEAPGQI